MATLRSQSSAMQLVKVAGSRWKIEDGFAAGKELAALDEHQVRSWTSWHRWTILALLAHAFLSVLASQASTSPPPSMSSCSTSCAAMRSSSLCATFESSSNAGSRPGTPALAQLPPMTFMPSRRCASCVSAVSSWSGFTMSPSRTVSVALAVQTRSTPRFSYAHASGSPGTRERKACEID